MQTDILFQIWDRFERSGISEISLEAAGADGFRVTLKKPQVLPSAAGVRSMYEPAGNSAGDTVPEQPADTLPRTGPGYTQTGTGIRAPFVGTFYRSAEPEAEPFVKIGQQVKKGDVLGIIEAMKMMNEVTAPCDGTVKEIFIEDETMVEYDQLLMQIGE